MKRLFFALWPNNETRKQIDTFNKSIKSDNLKKVQRDNLHITLVFLGNVDAKAEATLRQTVESISLQPFVLQFDQLNYWQKPRILCLATQRYDPQLSILVNALKKTAEQCDIKTEKRPYQPHITLARKARTMIKIETPCIEWQAQSFCLVESRSTVNGVHYQVLQNWNFK